MRSSVAVSIDARGWLPEARACPSPNCDARPAGEPVSLIVLHGISLPAGQFGGPWIDALFSNRLETEAPGQFPELRDLHVSSHLLIRRDGELVQFVSLDRRAWHAGVSAYAGRERCNDFAIGIELEGADLCPYTASQYRRLADVLAAILARYPATRPDRIVGHSDIAPGRKTDPGPAFDWARLSRGLAQQQGETLGT